MVCRYFRRVTSFGVLFAAMLVLLGVVAPKAVGGEPELELLLPDRAVKLPVASSPGGSYVSLKALAVALAVGVRDGPGGVALSWDGRRLAFASNRRQAVAPHGTVPLSAPPRWRGGQWWVPLDGAALAARERFGADRVRWDPQSRRLSVDSPSVLIQAMRIGWHPDRLRVVLEAVRAVPWSVRGGDGDHLLLVLPGSRLSQDIVRRAFRAGPLRSVEPRQGDEGAEVRLTLDAPASQARWFALDNPFRIVVDLPRQGPGLRPGAGKSPPHDHGIGPRSAEGDLRPEDVEARMPAIPPGMQGRDPAPPEAADPGPESVPQSPAGPERRGALSIVIDPGHGGKDTGAIGPRGLKEKDVVLDIALRLRRLLVGRLGARVLLTRSDDTFVPLEERAAIANKAQADFFISLHVNSAPQVRATGVETYYLSREPSDGDARASATRENLALNLEGVGPREEEGVKAVLWDMAQSLTLRESSALAEMLLEDLARAFRKENRGVKHGPFVVLMTAAMPSALVEIGFISNPHEERRMQDEAYRQQIANSLAQGIGRFATRYQRRIGMQPPRPGRS